MTRSETNAVLSRTSGVYGLMAGLMYGTGMRLMECVRLRVKDIDFGYRQITVRFGKGNKDRHVPLPEKYSEQLQEHLLCVKEIHNNDLKQSFGEVYLPDALGRKAPDMAKEWGWQRECTCSCGSRHQRGVGYIVQERGLLLRKIR